MKKSVWPSYTKRNAPVLWLLSLPRSQLLYVHHHLLGYLFPIVILTQHIISQSPFIHQQAAVVHAQSRLLGFRSITGPRRQIRQGRRLQHKLQRHHTPWFRMATLSPPPRYMSFSWIYMPKGTARTTRGARSVITLAMLLLHMIRRLCRLLNAINLETVNC